MEVKSTRKKAKTQDTASIAAADTEVIQQAAQRLNAKPAATAGKGFKAGIQHIADGKAMIPSIVAQRLGALGKHYGLELDLTNVNLQTLTPDVLNKFRTQVELLTANSKFLPELLKLTASLMKADIKLVEFHRDLVQKSNDHQLKMDKATADIWLSMVGYGSKSGKLEHRTNVRSELVGKRDAAYADYYQNSVFGSESQLIDAEYQLLRNNGLVLKASKNQQLNLNQEVAAKREERKQQLQAYVASGK